MFGTVEIGGKKIEMVANAATPYRFKQVFHGDFLTEAIKREKDEVASIDLFVKMGFIMAKQAEKADFSRITEETFYIWLEQFDPTAVQYAVGEIANIYTGNTETSAVPKKRAARQKDE